MGFLEREKKILRKKEKKSVDLFIVKVVIIL